jgi:hypothetical protein
MRRYVRGSTLRYGHALPFTVLTSLPTDKPRQPPSRLSDQTSRACRNKKGRASLTHPTSRLVCTPSACQRAGVPVSIPPAVTVVVKKGSCWE